MNAIEAIVAAISGVGGVKSLPHDQAERVMLARLDALALQDVRLADLRESLRAISPVTRTPRTKGEAIDLLRRWHLMELSMMHSADS